MNRAEQAVAGLDVTAAGGVVLVMDGHTSWLVDESRWDAAYDALAALPALEDDEGGAEAYAELCRATCRGGGVVAAIDGGSTHGAREAQEALVRRALEAELIDQETADAMGGGGVAKRLEYVPEATAAGFGGPWLVTIRTGEQAEHAPARTGPTDGVTSGPVPLTSYQQGYPTREAAMAAHPGLREPATTTPRVMDANTGDVLPGRPSPELVEASLAVPHTWAVGASQDAEGVWQFVRPEDARPNTRTVWIQE